jgi:hypothetical protein
MGRPLCELQVAGEWALGQCFHGAAKVGEVVGRIGCGGDCGW